jgi:hypothetical protein
MLHALCWLTVARQPAVKIGVLFLMTLDTLAHAPVFIRQALNILHLTVTFLTGNFAVNVTLVIEQHVLGYIIDFDPGRRCVGVKVFVLLFYPGMFGDNVIMAMQAFFHRRDAGMIRISHIGVTILALDLFHPAVDIMTERNGLLRPDSAVRQFVKKENEHRYDHPGNQRRQNKYGIFPQGFDTSL